MAKKNSSDKFGFVYSTDPNFKFNQEDDGADTQTLEPKQQKLRLQFETKHRGGKAVTLVKNFIGTNTDLESLGKQLKTFCGTGGSVKDGEIIIQGDQRAKILPYLIKCGYTQTK
jgi:translation initiation factor 1